MLLVTCRCGAKYRVPEKLSGRRLKCKHCGEPISVQSLPHASHARSVDAPADVTPPSVRDADRPAWVPPLVDETQTHPGTEADRTESVSAYLKDCRSSLLFFVEPGNLVTFLVIGALAALQPLLAFGGLLGWIAALLINGWICALLFNTVANAAAGDRDLPNLTMEGGFLEDAVYPIFRFAATWLIVFLPAMIYAAVVGNGVSALLADREPVFLALIALGVFLWPMSVLIIAFGELSSWLRVDLVLRTLARTFGPYLVTLSLTGSAMVLFIFANRATLPITSGAAAHPLALAMLLEVFQLYIWLVTMWVIGLFYHHFKARFAWSWG